MKVEAYGTMKKETGYIREDTTEKTMMIIDMIVAIVSNGSYIHLQRESHELKELQVGLAIQKHALSSLHAL